MQLLLATSLGLATLKVTIRDHKLVPNQLTAPKGEAFQLEVTNEGPGTEEIESVSMHLEKVIPQGKTATLRVSPLKSGTYDLMGDFHQETCKGAVIVP